MAIGLKFAMDGTKLAYKRLCVSHLRVNYFRCRLLHETQKSIQIEKMFDAMEYRIMRFQSVWLLLYAFRNV